MFDKYSILFGARSQKHDSKAFWIPGSLQFVPYGSVYMLYCTPDELPCRVE